MTPEQEQALLAEVGAMKRHCGEMQLRLERLARAVCGPAQIHEGEAVVPKAFSPWPQATEASRAGVSVHENAVRAHESASDSTPAQDRLLREIRALRQEAKAMSDQAGQNLAQMARILRRWDDDGLPSSRFA